MKAPGAARIARFEEAPLARRDCLMRVDRWTARWKARICEGVSTGVVSIPEITEAHRISREELTRWLILYRQGGIATLKENSIPANRRAAA